MDFDYAILFYKEKDGKIDFNGSVLDTPDGQLTLKHLTTGGYYSKKPLFLGIEYTYFNDGGVDCLGVNASTFEFLRENYTGLNGKTFRTSEEKFRTGKAVGDLAWCSMMRDPYDIG